VTDTDHVAKAQELLGIANVDQFVDAAEALARSIVDAASSATPALTAEQREDLAYEAGLEAAGSATPAQPREPRTPEEWAEWGRWDAEGSATPEEDTDG
jgi:spore cortex formation protein SpoVR/YcgB (stage V sporulation)